MEKQLLKSIDLNPVNVMSSWREIKNYILSIEPSEKFTDIQRLRIFVANFMEYFREYEVLKNCEEDEYHAVLYYMAISNDAPGQIIQGEELRMLIRILSRLRENI